MTQVRPLVALTLGVCALAVAPGRALYADDAVVSADAALVAFGRAVAIAGDQAFIGEPGGRGAGGQVWVYRRVGGTWQKSATLTLPSGQDATGFGASLAADGTTLLVGQVVQAFGGRPGGPGGQAAPPQPAGVVHWYSRNAAGTWTHQGVLPGSYAAGAQFGAALTLAGDMAYVGAPGQSDGGAVHLFRRGTAGWTAAGILPATGLAAGDSFGSSISVDGNRVAVGATGLGGKGAVHIFSRAANGSWSLEANGLVSRRTPDNAMLGSTLLLKGDRLLVGAPRANFVMFTRPDTSAPVAGPPRVAPRGGFGGGMGMVVTFQRNAASGAWIEQGLIAPYDFPANAGFGTALAMVNDEIWVGAPSADGNGRIYRVRLSADGSVASMSKLAVDSMTNSRGAQFGSTLAVSGGQAVIGMPGDASGLGTVAFVERNATGTWTTRGTVFPPVVDRFAKVTGKEALCNEQGEAGAFHCGNSSLLSFLPISAVGGGRASRMNDNWGWTDPETGREYALAGRTDGTSFVDVTDPVNPRYLGDLPMTPGATPGAWRDIKVYRNHAYVVADGSGEHGMQVFDLTRLRNIRTPQTFTPDAHYTRINSAHNIVINEESGFAYSVGGSAGGEICGGGLHMIDIREPKNPTFAGCWADGITGRRGTGYSHDAQCVIYRGPDEKYRGKEICIGSNETAISIADVTNKQSPTQISTASYPFVSYAHQGWLTDDHRYFYLDDESDEIAAQRDTTGQNMAGKGTRTMVYDLADLDDPVLVKEYIGPVRSSDHNLYVKGNKLYLANYGSGLRIVDISDPVNPREVAYLDTYPDDENQPQMVGAWSNYPYFKSGTIVVTSVTEGLFLVKDRSTAVP